MIFFENEVVLDGIDMVGEASINELKVSFYFSIGSGGISYLVGKSIGAIV